MNAHQRRKLTRRLMRQLADFGVSFKGYGYPSLDWLRRELVFARRRLAKSSAREARRDG